MEQYCYCGLRFTILLPACIRADVEVVVVDTEAEAKVRYNMHHIIALNIMYTIQ